MKLENGRPENTEGRLEKEIRVYDFLDKLGVEYQRVDHEAAMTMEACGLSLHIGPIKYRSPNVDGPLFSVNRHEVQKPAYPHKAY